jgi:hypothetical protein
MAAITRLPTSRPRRNRLTRRALKTLHSQIDQLARETPSLVAILARLVNYSFVDVVGPPTKGAAS